MPIPPPFPMPYPDTSATLDTASSTAATPSATRPSRTKASTIEASAPATTGAKTATRSPRRSTATSSRPLSRAADQADRAARETVMQLRDEACDRARPLVKAGAAPIRVMARMVDDLEAACRERNIPQEIVAAEVINRTIGDVDLRRISARDDGPEFVSLADEMGLALPGEVFDGGYVATGERYRAAHERMLDFERQLLARHFDLRMYDLSGVGNPLLREMIAAQTQKEWGFSFPPAQLYLSLGSLDGICKFWLGYTALLRKQGITSFAALIPSPGFNVPEWQAQTLGWRMHRVHTRPEDHFKLTPEDLRQALDDAPDLRAFYLTVSNNPTAFAYAPYELRALFAVIQERRPDLVIVADLAYIGTADPAEDRVRMQAFNDPETLARTAFCCSYSKSHTLTGDRCGWVGFGAAQLAQDVGPGWTNSTAALPAEWQLRYMAHVQFFAEHPEIEQRIRALYLLRRGRLVEHLRRLNTKQQVFAQINLDDGGTVYNWSQLTPGEDVFSLFSKTGIAGVPGSAFGYSDDFVRLSIGCIPVSAN
ncbi:MAG: pyridoxal phosphate-dependent aminotransferase [Ktedonobacterales bacterium]